MPSGLQLFALRGRCNRDQCLRTLVNAELSQSRSTIFGDHDVDVGTGQTQHRPIQHRHDARAPLLPGSSSGRDDGPPAGAGRGTACEFQRLTMGKLPGALSSSAKKRPRSIRLPVIRVWSDISSAVAPIDSSRKINR